MIDPSTHPVNFLKVPKNLDELPPLQAITGFVAPRAVESQNYCTQTEDQGIKPWCAAYSTTSFAENILWKITHHPVQFDPAPVYARAKQLDGDPHGDGTTLDAAMQAFLDVYPDQFDKACQIKLIRCFGGNFNDIKFALHSYGAITGGFMIRDAWYNCDANSKGFIPSGGNPIGGHAVLICGYNEKGLIIQNSWSENFGTSGFALLRWEDVKEQFMYGCVLRGCFSRMF